MKTPAKIAAEVCAQIAVNPKVTDASEYVALIVSAIEADRAQRPEYVDATVEAEAARRYPDDYAHEGDKYSRRVEFTAGARWAAKTV